MALPSTSVTVADAASGVEHATETVAAARGVIGRTNEAEFI